MKNILFVVLISSLLSGCYATGGGYRPMYVSAPMMVQQATYQQQVPSSAMQGRNPCSVESGVAHAVAGAIVGTAVGALLGNNHRAAGFGAGVGLLSGGASASYECQQYMYWVAANTPRTTCTVQRTNVNGEVSMVETCTSQETRVGYGKW